MDVRARNHVVRTGSGDGPVVVLSHGFGCDQNLWRLVAPTLAARSPVVLFDHVGARAGRTCRRGTSATTRRCGATPTTSWTSFARAVFASVALRLHPGDTLLLYTDGLTEARTGGGTHFDEEPLREFLAALAPSTAPRVVAAVRTLLDGFGAELDDDTAVLAVGVPPAPDV